MDQRSEGDQLWPVRCQSVLQPWRNEFSTYHDNWPPVEARPDLLGKKTCTFLDQHPVNGWCECLQELTEVLRFRLLVGHLLARSDDRTRAVLEEPGQHHRMHYLNLDSIPRN